MQTRPFSLKDYPLAETVWLLNSLQKLPNVQQGGQTLAAMLTVAGLASPFVLPEGVLPPVVSVELPAVIVALAAASFFLQRMKSIGATWASTPALTSHPVVSVGSEGVTIEGAGGRSTVFWNSVRDIVAGADGQVILTSRTGFIPLPASAFASALRTRIPTVKEPF